MIKEGVVMNKVISIFSGLTLSGVALYCIKLSVRGYVRKNPEEVITMIFNGVGFVLTQAINLFEWMLRIVL